MLLSPGSGEDVFLVGGGIPPYRLRPLSAQDQQIAVAELKDTFIEVTGLKEGSIELEVEDSANFPTMETVTVNVKEPVFNAVFDITPHTLLAGSSPAFAIKIRQAGEHMRLLRSEFRVEKASTDFSSLEEGGILGIQKQSVGLTPEFHYLQVSSIDATEGLSFHVQRVVDGSLAVSAEGSLGKGSAVMTLRPVPEPPAEGVVRSNMETEIVLSDQVIRLPDAPGETFDVIATLTSTTVLEGHELPFTKTVTRSFTTVTPTSGAPRVERLLPFHGEMGHRVEIVGSDFDPVPENNQVTFQGSDNTRVEAPVLAASAQELLVYVPEGAVTGAVRVAIDDKQSNDFLFRVLFQPDAGIFFAAGDVIEAEPVPGETQGDGLNLPTQQSPGTLAPVILLAQEPDEVAFASLLVFVDGGSLNSADLEENASAGTASLVNNSTGNETLFQLSYGGLQETESGIGKHIFDLKQEVGGSSQATLLVSEESEGTGIVFEMTSSGLSVLGSSLSIRFENRIYLLPETMDTPIKMRIEVRSAQWNFFRGSEGDGCAGRRGVHRSMKCQDRVVPPKKSKLMVLLILLGSLNLAQREQENPEDGQATPEITTIRVSIQPSLRQVAPGGSGSFDVTASCGVDPCPAYLWTPLLDSTGIKSASSSNLGEQQTTLGFTTKSGEFISKVKQMRLFNTFCQEWLPNTPL